MCRHLAYLGPVVSLGRLLSEPEHSLVRQSWAPRRQRNGTVNADGFGIGWYAEGDPVPARYRRAARSGRPHLRRPHPRGAQRRRAGRRTGRHARGGRREAAAAPFSDGRWLFSHNGSVRDWPESAAPLAAGLPVEELLQLAARTDSALIWALVLHRLRAGDDLGAALAGPVRDLASAAPASRLNLLLTDGSTIAATAWGDSLWYLADPPAGRVVVASEPHDDDSRWCEVPDRTLLTATRTRVDLTPLKESRP